MAIIGFSNAHPVKIRQLGERHARRAEIVQFFHSDRDVVLFVMDASKEALTKRLYHIMERLEQKPCVYITSPVIAKFEASIPEVVLEGVYADLPDRRLRV